MACNTKHEAEKAGQALLDKLDNKTNWVVKVWENMGWHYCIECGSMQVSPALGDGQYFALMSTSAQRPGEGFPEWTTNFRSSDPNEVISHQIKQALSFVKQCQDSILSVTF